MAEPTPPTFKHSFLEFGKAVAKDCVTWLAAVAELVALAWLFSGKPAPTLALWLIQLGAALIFLAAAASVYHRAKVAAQAREAELLRQIQDHENRQGDRLKRAKEAFARVAYQGSQLKATVGNFRLVPEWSVAAHRELSAVLATTELKKLDPLIVLETDYDKLGSLPRQQTVDQKADYLRQLADNLTPSMLAESWR